MAGTTSLQEFALASPWGPFRRCRWFLAFWVVLTLAISTQATPRLDAFEAALDNYRFKEAQRLIWRLPEGPEKLLAQAELAIATEHPELTYAVTDQLRPADLPPRLRAKYYLVQLYQDRLENLRGREGRQRPTGLMQAALSCDPAPRERARLLLEQLILARGDGAEAETLVKDLFAISPVAGFQGRLMILRRKELYDEALALYRLLVQRALDEGQTQRALTYRHMIALLLLRTGESEEALESVEQIFEETLSSDEQARIPNLLVTLHWSLGEAKGQALKREVIDETLKRLQPGEVVLETLFLAARRFPEHPAYFTRGIALADKMDRPLIAAGFLLEQARIESDPNTARQQRDRARKLIGDRDLRGIGGAWYGDQIVRSLFAAGLDIEDDRELRGRFLEVVKSGRNDSEISDLTSALLAGAADRAAPWIWVEPLFEDVLERSEGWSKSQRAGAVTGAIHLLQRSWAEPKMLGQNSTFAPRPRAIAEALGAGLKERPEIIEEVLAGRAELERGNDDARRTSDMVSTLADFLNFLGRESEAEDLYREAVNAGNDSVLGSLRTVGHLAQVEYSLGLSSATGHFDRLAHTDFKKDYSNYDQPWRRATELAWVSLERGLPAEAERLAEVALTVVPKGWEPAKIRRLGAHEALAFAIADLGRDDELRSLLGKWEKEQEDEGDAWLATLKTDLLIRSGRMEEAAGQVADLDDVADEARRVYIANQRRVIANALSRPDEASEMEGEIAHSVDVMVGDSIHLRRVLLDSPAYMEMMFLSRPDAPPDDAVRGTTENLEQILQRLEVVRRREPDNEALAQLSAVQVKSMADAAGRDQVIVHPVQLPHSVLLLAASGGRVVLRERFVDRTRMQEAISRLTSLAADPNTTTARMEDDGAYLAQRFLEPVRSEFPDRPHLLWWAAGELKQLPLALLRLEGGLVIEQMTVTYLDSPRADSIAPLQKSSAVLLIGGSDDLAGATQELAGVRSMFPRGDRWKLGDDFERLRKLAHGHPLVHIASHGLPPTAGHLGGELSGSQGSLSAFRLADLDFAPGSLVVASACQVAMETGSGPGDSTVLNALRTAGAGAVIGSPWPIDDATSRDLVLSFYRQLLKSGEPSRALAAAQLEIRRTHPHPFFWAGSRLLTGQQR